MKIYKSSLITIILCIAVLFCLSIPSAMYAGLGNHAAPFLQISPGARQVAMGEAFTGLAYDDINLMRYNIGGLGSINKMMLAVNYHDWIDDTQQGSIGLALPSRFGVIGFDFNYFNEGKLTELDPAFVPTGTIYESNDIAISLGYGSYLQILKKKFLFGGGLKLIRQNLANESASALGLDLGALLWLKNFSFGIAINNFSITKFKFINTQESLPEIYRAGFGGRFSLSSKLKMNIDFDIAYLTKQDLRYYSGAEFLISNRFMIRGGYKIHEFETNRWSAGMGFLIPMDWLASSETRLDYAYTPVDEFDDATHRFSLLFRFGETVQTHALNIPDEQELANLNKKLRNELIAAEKARQAAEDAELRTRALEDTLKARLERIQRIAGESEGKIEIVEATTPDGEIKDKILVSMRINFDFDKANIRPEDFSTMHQIGEILNTYPNSQVFISGHTDSVGTYEYNIRLSQLRVDSVMAYLTTKGNVNYSRFFNPIGYGKLKYIADNSTEEGRFRNRRVDFLIHTRDAQPEIPEGSAIKTVRMISDSVVHIVGNGVLPYTDMMLRYPTRLVIDLPWIFLLTSRTNFEFNKGPLIRARLGYHPDKFFSRVVLDLVEPVSYNIQSVNNILVIRLR